MNDVFFINSLNFHHWRKKKKSTGISTERYSILIIGLYRFKFATATTVIMFAKIFFVYLKEIPG